MLRGKTFVGGQFWNDALQSAINGELIFDNGSFFGKKSGFDFSISEKDDTIIGITAKNTDFGTELITFVANDNSALIPFTEFWEGSNFFNPAQPHYLDTLISLGGLDGKNDLVSVRPEIFAGAGTGSDTFIVRDIGQLDILDFSLNDTIAFDLGVLQHLPGQQAGVDALLPHVTGVEWIGDNFQVSFGDTATLTFHDVTPEIVDIGIVGLQNVEVWS